MNSRNIVPIVFNIDNNYYIGLIVTIISMLKHKKESTFYDIYIMTEEIIFNFKKNLSLLEENYKEHIKINYIDMKNFGNDFNLTEQFGKSSYYRLFIYKYINHYDKVLYSDVDVLIIQDLYDIYVTDLKDTYLGATYNQHMNIIANNNISIKNLLNSLNVNIGNYFNSGFLLIDLHKVRELELDTIIVNLSKKKYQFPDQDILNEIFHKKITYLHPRYCYYADADFWKNYSKSDLLKFHTNKEIEEYINNPAIIHFVSFKPWALRYKLFSTVFIEKYKDLDIFWYEQWYEYLYLSLKYIPKYEVFLYYKNYYIEANKYFKDYSVILNDKWYLFGQLSKKQKIKVIIRVFLKKLRIYSLIKFFIR